MYSIRANKILRKLGPRTAMSLKYTMIMPRYYYMYIDGIINTIRYKKNYESRMLLVCSLPKSGSSWLERMLSILQGYTPIIPYQLNYQEIAEISASKALITIDMIKKLQNKLFVVKTHAKCDTKMADMLAENNIYHCYLYRDLRDAAVSYVHYVRMTPHHMEHNAYRGLDIKEGLHKFCEDRLEDWVDWVNLWKSNATKKYTKEIKYEEMKFDTQATLCALLEHYKIKHDGNMIDKMIYETQLDKLQKIDKSGENSFFRKGIVGDWKNYFGVNIKNKFKEKAGELLISTGYEKNMDW